MSKRLDLIGKQFGQLTVLSYHSNGSPIVANPKDKKSYWYCQCVCGKTTIVSGMHLTRKHTSTKTCGCKTGIYAHLRTFHRHGTSGFRMFHSAKGRAKDLGMDFDLVHEDIIVPEFCPLCEKKLSRGSRVTNASPSLDRLDNFGGYTKDNILVVCYQCNGTKRDHISPDELETIARNWRRITENKIP